MPQIAIDMSTGDLAVDGGFYSVSDYDEIRQDLWLRLQIIRGEIVYDTDAGVPYPGEVFAAGTPPERIVQIFRETILGTPGVTGFAEGGFPRLDVDEATRALTLSFRATSDAGVLDFTGPESVPLTVPQAA